MSLSKCLTLGHLRFIPACIYESRTFLSAKRHHFPGHRLHTAMMIPDAKVRSSGIVPFRSTLPQCQGVQCEVWARLLYTITEMTLIMTQRPGFEPGPVHVRFVADKVSTERSFGHNRIVAKSTYLPRHVRPFVSRFQFLIVADDIDSPQAPLGRFTHTMPFPCCSHAVTLLFPCRFKDGFTHTMPFSCHSHWPLHLRLACF
jgi:hypothetical protein